MKAKEESPLAIDSYKARLDWLLNLFFAASIVSIIIIIIASVVFYHLGYSNGIAHTQTRLLETTHD